MTKTCKDCHEEKSITDFHRNSSMADGRLSFCIPCSRIRRGSYTIKVNPDFNRNWAYRKQYGITLDDYNTMHATQDGRCAICGRPEVVQQGQRHKRLAVDHDHETGRIRGLLCHARNTGLGQFGEETTRLRSAIEYLEGASC